MLRSPDAIHLAAAQVLGPDLTGLATYDDRLAAAGRDAGFEVVSRATDRTQLGSANSLAQGTSGPRLVEALRSVGGC